MKKPKILVFASGSENGGGAGFEKLVEASLIGTLNAEIIAVVSNHKNGGVRERACRLGIQFIHFKAPWSPEEYQRIAIGTGAEFFALSGWKELVTGLDPSTNFNSKTVFSIHPGPLPEFGRPGLHGHLVHEAVIEAYKRGDTNYSAVSMNFVTNEHGFGPHFFNLRIRIMNGDTASSLGQRVTAAEHKFQAIITNRVVNGMIKWDGINPNSLEFPGNHSVNCFESCS